MGTSITSGGNTDIPEVDSFRALGGRWLQNQYPSKNLTNHNGSTGGTDTWNALVRMQTDLIDYVPTLIVMMEAANNNASAFHLATFEAWIRRVWTEFPNMPIVWTYSLSVDDALGADPIAEIARDDAVRAAHSVILDYYDIPLVDYPAEVERRVIAEENDLVDFYDDGDYVHQNALGNQVIYELQQPVMVAAIAAGHTGLLPSRLYADSEDYEREPTRILGNAYDSRTGAWSDSGTVVSSVEANATITYTATCQSIGIHRGSGNIPTVEVSIDGGAYASMQVHQNGTELGVAYGEHTIAIKLVSGTLRIEEFWAI